MLTQEIRDALKAELDSIMAQRSKLEAKIEALHAILSPVDELQLFAHDSKTNPPIKRTRWPKGPHKSGLRDSLMTTLRKYPSGLDVAAIALELEMLGIQPKGKTSLKSLVSSEAWRLKNRGVLIKKGKKYLLPIEEKDNNKEKRGNEAA